MAAMVIFSFQNRPYASRHHIDCRRGDAFFVAKSPSRNVISIGWRRYLMAAGHLSNHKLMIVATEKAYACISPALRIATCMLGRRGRVAAGRSLLEASPSFRAAVTNSGLTSLVVALTSRVGECKCGGTGAWETLNASPQPALARVAAGNSDRGQFVHAGDNAAAARFSARERQIEKRQLTR
jgi:hypothetical protein